MCTINSAYFYLPSLNPAIILRSPCQVTNEKDLSVETRIQFTSIEVGMTIKVVWTITGTIGSIDVASNNINITVSDVWIINPSARAFIAPLTPGTYNISRVAVYQIADSSQILLCENTSFTTQTACATATVPEPTSPQVFNVCWGLTTMTGPCGTPPSQPTVTPGSLFRIVVDVANGGAPGQVRLIMKNGTTVISDQTNANLGTFPAGGLWSPFKDYTMPSSSFVLNMDAYGWNGSVWVLKHTQSTTISPTAPTCSGISITTNKATGVIGDIFRLTASSTPTTQPYTVTFTDQNNRVIGTCTTSNGTCFKDWNTTGETSGIYYIKAQVIGQCISPEVAISLSVPINQWNVNITVRDNTTNAIISGATVQIGTQTKTTGVDGSVTFRVDEGQISITISKSGYNTLNDTQLVFNDVNLTERLIPVTPTTGSIQFVVVTPGATPAANISLDSNPVGTTNSSGLLLVSSIPAGTHNYSISQTGFNTVTGSVVVSGGVQSGVNVSLSPVTPTTGDVQIFSTPAGAEIYIDNIDQLVTTTRTITGLTPTSHTYKLTLTGYQDATGSFTIIAGQTATLNVTLVALSTIGSLEISSLPNGARIYIDNIDTGRITPATITNLEQGAHNYKLVLTGYQDATNSFTITAGQTTTLTNIPLTPMAPTTGTLKIASSPPGAKIFIDNTDTGYITGSSDNPTSVPNLSEGPHSYTLKYQGYADATGNFTIIAGNITGPLIIMMSPVSPVQGGISPILVLGGIGLLALWLTMRSGQFIIPARSHKSV